MRIRLPYSGPVVVDSSNGFVVGDACRTTCVQGTSRRSGRRSAARTTLDRVGLACGAGTKSALRATFVPLWLARRGGQRSPTAPNGSVLSRAKTRHAWWRASPQSPCQGEGRGFESRRPLQAIAVLSRANADGHAAARGGAGHGGRTLPMGTLTERPRALIRGVQSDHDSCPRAAVAGVSWVVSTAVVMGTARTSHLADDVGPLGHRHQRRYGAARTRPLSRRRGGRLRGLRGGAARHHRQQQRTQKTSPKQDRPTHHETDTHYKLIVKRRPREVTRTSSVTNARRVA
jgi:hypothetical protein